MSEPIYKVYKATIKNVDTENYVVDAVVTTQTPDRDNEIVSVQGFEKGLQEYRKHPVLLSCHEWRDLRKNIGQAEDFRFKDTEAEIKFRYFAGKGNEEADWAFQLAQEGIAAYSIGFIPKDSRKPDDAEKAEGVERVFTDLEVLEISQVLIPSNRDALQVRQKMARIEEELCSQALHLNIEQISESKPYENEHACRLRDPDDFQAESIRRTTRKHDGKEYSVIMGKLKGEDTMTEQAYRYKKDIWTVSSAQAHCKDHKGTFEAAKVENVAGEQKNVIPYKDLGIAPESEAWDGNKEVAAADVDVLRIICTWYDAENPDVKASYKLPHHSAAGNHLAVWRGVAAAMGALLGARGGVDIPEGDRQRCYNHLSRHYEAFEKEPPEFKDSDTTEKHKSVPGIFEIEGFTEPTNEHYHDFRMSKDINGIIVGQTIWMFPLGHDEYEMVNMLRQHKHLIIVRDVTTEMEGHTHEITVFKSMDVQGDAGSTKLGDATSLALVDTKEGRTLSAATLAALQEIQTALENSLGKIRTLIDSASTVDVPSVVTETVSIIWDADIWTALRAIQ